jgi:hypothetical protein
MYNTTKMMAKGLIYVVISGDFEFPLLIKLFICFYGTIYALLVITFCTIL